MTTRQFGISSDIYCSSLHTNNLNAANIDVGTLTPDDIDLPIGGEYRIGGFRVVNTPFLGSSIAVGNTLPINQGNNTVALGNFCATNNQGQYSIAIGSNTATTSQGQFSIAIGTNTGQVNQGNNSIAIGTNACSLGSGTNNVCIGDSACNTAIIGTHNTCIGDSATINAGVNSSIVIGAGGVATASNQLVIASAAHPITTVGSAGAIGQYLPITLNGVNYKLALYAP